MSACIRAASLQCPAGSPWLLRLARAGSPQSRRFPLLRAAMRGLPVADQGKKGLKFVLEVEFEVCPPRQQNVY